MAQKKPAWHNLYQKNEPPTEHPLIRVGGLKSELEKEWDAEQKRIAQKKRHKKRRRKTGTGYTVLATLLTVVLIGGLVAMSTVQTLHVQAQSKSLAAYTAQIADLQTQVSDLEQEKQNLTEENEALQAQGLVTAAGTGGEESFDYQQMYPDLQVANVPTAFAEPQEKQVYLTFNDGPSGNTEAILDVLKEQSAHATFFVRGSNIKGHEDLLQRMVKEGHAIGLYTYTNLYDSIYSDVKTFLEDENRAYEAIYNACGVYPAVFRFPAGSINRYTSTNYTPYVAEMLRRGFVYYDWNVTADTLAPTVTATETQTDSTAEDADTETTDRTADTANTTDTPAETKESTQTMSAQTLANNLVFGVQSTKYPTVLLYDAAGKSTTAAALEKALTKLQAQGYTFAALDNTVQPITFTAAS